MKVENLNNDNIFIKEKFIRIDPASINVITKK